MLRYACLQVTPDKHFIIDVHPTWKNIFIAAGFSGQLLILIFIYLSQKS